MALLATLSSTVLDVAVDESLGSMMLEDLEVPPFPITTNLSRGRPEVVTRSTVGAGVRASGSMPGVFAATITRTGLYVDGAFTDNMPVGLLELEGGPH